MLDRDQIIDYVLKAKNGDENAKEILFRQNSPLIKSVIKRFKNKGVEYDDLYQIGCIGFIKAINNFDVTYGVQFSTYTVPMIIGEIKRYMRDNGAIKVSRSLKILANKINRYVDEYQAQNGEAPKVNTIAETFDISQEEVVVAMDSSRMPISIHDRFEEDEEGQALIDKIPSNYNEDVELNKIHLSTLIERLSEKEKKIVVLRYFRDKTQSEVAEYMGVSQVQISRLESKILNKIRVNF